ncbi:MAG TPA: hypothetical protein VIL20_21155 [Sandaracinaceae bacterium]
MRRALALSLALAACGSSRARPTEPPELFDLSEARALEIVGEVLSEEGVAPGAAWSVQLGAGARLDVDVRLASSSFGIEWISPQDRADLGDAVPGPTPDGRLRIVPGAGDDAGAEVLVLDHASYRYANDRDAVQRGTDGALEAEGRLRRDVRDFLHYVRGRGGLPPR